MLNCSPIKRIGPIWETQKLIISIFEIVKSFWDALCKVLTICFNFKQQLTHINTKIVCS